MGTLAEKLAVTFVGNLSLIDELCEALSALPSPGDIGQPLLDAFERPDELFLFETDRSIAAGTDELVVRAYPTDRLLVLVAAARARNPDLSGIEQLLLRHRRPPVEDGQHSAAPSTALPPTVPMDGAS